MSSALLDTLARRELIEKLARRLGRHPAVERVWLFGSRARGDNFERSDVDLAVEAPDMDRYDGLKIEFDFEDEAPTLLAIDLLRWRKRRSICVSRSGTRGSWLMNERALRHLFDDLGRSLDRLAEAVAVPEDEPLAIDGTIPRFELTFEVFWKAVRRPAGPARHRGQLPKGGSTAGIGSVDWMTSSSGWTS